MRIFSIIEKLGDVNANNSQGLSRRESLFSIGNIGKDLAMAAVPLTILGIIPKTSNGQTTTASKSILEVLNFALTLEYLESSFYIKGVDSAVIPPADMKIFNQIKKHEISHVAFLQAAITSLGGKPVSSPTFDFTAKGAFNPFGDYEQFLALSQAFEDTGVRAYKGQAGNLMSNNAILTAALQIHSVEARHASEVRRLRNKNGFDPSAKGWITDNSRGTLPAATQASYDGEDNTSQGGVDVKTLTSFPKSAVTEAFDEPLSYDTVLAIATLFIKAK